MPTTYAEISPGCWFSFWTNSIGSLKLFRGWISNLAYVRLCFGLKWSISGTVKLTLCLLTGHGHGSFSNCSSCPSTSSPGMIPLLLNSAKSNSDSTYSRTETEWFALFVIGVVRLTESAPSGILPRRTIGEGTVIGTSSIVAVIAISTGSKSPMLTTMLSLKNHKSQ